MKKQQSNHKDSLCQDDITVSDQSEAHYFLTKIFLILALFLLLIVFSSAISQSRHQQEQQILNRAVNVEHYPEAKAAEQRNGVVILTGKSSQKMKDTNINNIIINIKKKKQAGAQSNNWSQICNLSNNYKKIIFAPFTQSAFCEEKRTGDESVEFNTHAITLPSPHPIFITPISPFK